MGPTGLCCHTGKSDSTRKIICDFLVDESRVCGSPSYTEDGSGLMCAYHYYYRSAVVRLLCTAGQAWRSSVVDGGQGQLRTSWGCSGQPRSFPGMAVCPQSLQTLHLQPGLHRDQDFSGHVPHHVMVQSVYAFGAACWLVGSLLA